MKKLNTFTLIEVLIAIVVFGIGILTIIQMILQNISTVDKIRNKTTATFLARQSLEMVYNLRDSNLDKGLLRKCFLLDSNFSCSNNFQVGNYYKIFMNKYGYYNISTTDSIYDNNVLYYHTGLLKDTAGNNIFTGFWYDYDNSGIKTNFASYLFFTGAYLQGNNGFADNEKLMKVDSHVVIKKGGYSQEVVLESFIGEIR